MMNFLSLSDTILCGDTNLILQLLHSFIFFARMVTDLLVAKQNPNTTLLPKDTKAYAEVIQWCSFANHEVLPHLGLWFGPVLGRDPYNKKSVDAAEVGIKRIMKYLDGYFLDHTYLVGERLTLADVVMTALLARGFQYVFSI